MTGDPNAPKNEFANFLDDIAEEISQRVESLAAPRERRADRVFSEDRHVIDWPNIADRMIDEMR